MRSLLRAIKSAVKAAKKNERGQIFSRKTVSKCLRPTLSFEEKKCKKIVNDKKLKVKLS